MKHEDYTATATTTILFTMYCANRLEPDVLHFHYYSMLVISNTKEDMVERLCLKRNTRINFE